MNKLRTAMARAIAEPGLFRNLAILGALLVLGAVAGGIILANQRMTWPWEDKQYVSAAFEQTPGISPGNGQEVRIAGVPVGQIVDAGVDDAGDAVLEMEIDGGHQVFDNAKVVLRPKSPLNEMFVNLDPGGPPGNPLPEGAVLPVANSVRPVQVEEVLGHLDTNTRDALGQLLSESDTALASAPQALPGGVGAADRVLQKLQPVVQQLETRRATLARLVTALSTISASVGQDDERLDRLATSLHGTLKAVAAQQQRLDDALGQLPGVSDSLRESTAAVTELADQLDPTLDNVKGASERLPGALERLNGSVDQLDRTLDSAAPFVAAARPVAADLRPMVDDANSALDDVQPITSRLDTITGEALPYLTDLRAFVYNTNDVASLRDPNRGIFRGTTQVAPTSLPLPLQGVAGTPNNR